MTSKPSTLAQTLNSLPLPLFSADWSPRSAHGDHRPHVREGLAPPLEAVSVSYWLRFSETRMSTGMRGARGRALGWDGARALSLRSRKEGAAGGLKRALGFLLWRLGKACKQMGVLLESAGEYSGE